MDFPRLTDSALRQRVAAPAGPVSLVLDTDTYNEIDDQFALVYALLSTNLDLQAVYAAPFHNRRSSGPGDGMERSYEEILRVMDRLGVDRVSDVYRGSTQYLPSASEPVASDAVTDLIARAEGRDDDPLYVVAVGAITNVASALLTDPSLVKRIVVVWLGGQPLYWPTASEFNLKQDVPAAQVVFDSGVPLFHIPCKNVAEHIRTTLPEVERYVKGRGPIGDYLHEIYLNYAAEHYARSKVLWDISTIAYLNQPEWVPAELHPSPVLRDDVTWDTSSGDRHPIAVAVDARRDAIFGDLFRKLEARAQGS